MNEANLKPSGLRPPSKIGRPCLGTNPKPAVPSTPKISNILLHSYSGFLILLIAITQF